MKNLSIKTEHEFEEAANRIERLAHATPGSREALELKQLMKALIRYTKANLFFSVN